MPYKNRADQAEAQRRHYLANKSAYHGRNAELVSRRRQYLTELKQRTPCMDCGLSYPGYVMDFDHRDPSKKVDLVGRLASFGWKQMLAEVEKCDIVCSNCHRERTYGGERRVGSS